MRNLAAPILAASVVACLAVAVLVPTQAWSQFQSFSYMSSVDATSESTTESTTDPTATESTTTAAATVAPLGIWSTAGTIAGPGNFTGDRSNPEQNVIYEVFGGVGVNVCITIQNGGRLGDVLTIVDGFQVGDSVKPSRTRTRCLAAPQRIELSCTSSLCSAVWRVDRF